MEIGILASDSTPMLLGKVLCYTVFYAGLAYLPLRLAVDLLGRAQKIRQDRRALNRPRTPDPVRYVID